MSILGRGEILEPTEQMNLTVQFKDYNGDPVDTDSYPKIAINQPNGLVFLAPTSSGVGRLDVGKYSYIFTAPINGPLGVWNDTWVGFINGFRVETTFQFILNTTQTPGINLDGYIHLGDDPGFDYSQAAIKNINKLIKALKARLNSSGKSKSTDGYRNVTYVTCDIFSVDMLVTFLATALGEFNQTPYLTFFKFDDDNFVDQFFEILVEGATLYSLASKALIERGLEYNITDNGVSFTPPTVSELLMTQYSALLSSYNERLKYIKNSLRPSPIGLGTFSMTSGGLNPAVARMRHLRARRLY